MTESKNAPELRFPGFTEPWEEKKLGEVNIVNQATSIPEEFYYIDLESVNEGRVDKKLYCYKASSAPSRAQRLLKKGDILYSTVRPYQNNNLYIDFKLDKPIVASTGFAILNSKVNKRFQYYYIYMYNFTLEVLKRCTGTSYPAISAFDLKKINIKIPSLAEQEKIGFFFSSLDKKLDLQKDKLEELKSYKKGMMQRIFDQEIRFKDENGRNYPDWQEKKLGEISDITTGKLDANAMDENGKYRFYTCAKEFYRINKYDFDTEALLISGNGANVGYIHHYKGRFNAYQRTYVIDKFKEDISYIKHFLNINLAKRIEKTKNSGNTPYIKMSTLSDMRINLPSLAEQEKIASFLSALDRKIELEEEKLRSYEEFKKGLMQRMFV